VAFNDVLLLKAARRDASANIVFWASMVSFTFPMRRHFIPLAP